MVIGSGLKDRQIVPVGRLGARREKEAMFDADLITVDDPCWLASRGHERHVISGGVHDRRRLFRSMKKGQPLCKRALGWLEMVDLLLVAENEEPESGRSRPFVYYGKTRDRSQLADEITRDGRRARIPQQRWKQPRGDAQDPHWDLPCVTRFLGRSRLRLAIVLTQLVSSSRIRNGALDPESPGYQCAELNGAPTPQRQAKPVEPPQLAPVSQHAA
jgi:hypothetical protein